MAALKHGNSIRLALVSAWRGTDAILLSELRFSLHRNTVVLHLDIPPCLVISDTSRPVVQGEHLCSITPETTAESCGQVNQLWENSGVCSWKPAEKIYHEKPPYITFSHGERTKNLLILWGVEVKACLVTLQPDFNQILLRANPAGFKERLSSLFIRLHSQTRGGEGRFLQRTSKR